MMSPMQSREMKQLLSVPVSSRQQPPSLFLPDAPRTSIDVKGRDREDGGRCSPAHDPFAIGRWPYRMIAEALLITQQNTCAFGEANDQLLGDMRIIVAQSFECAA